MPHRLKAILLTALLSVMSFFGIHLTPASAIESPIVVKPPISQALPKAEVKPEVNEVLKTAVAAPVKAPSPIERGSFVAEAVRSMGNAVVRIDTEKTISRKATVDPMLDDPFFRQFFGGGEMLAPPRSEMLRGQGSGFLIDQSGILLTNSHVVNGADKVTVTLKDGRKFEGKVSGIDEVTDLAVVKIEGKNLPIAALGDSDATQVGDWAIAVGNPLGLDNTVTLGIVSTLKRTSSQIGMSNKRLDFIQTDAAINPGNSGGPLLNSSGEVIGINTAIRADAMGIGFAIPINKAKELKDQLSRGERIRHPYLGIQMSSFEPDMAKTNNEDPNALLKLPEVSGVIVLRVLENTPAAKAGVRRYDVITSVDGQAISSAEQLQQVVDRSRLGKALKVELRRGEQSMQLSVRTAELKDEEA